VFCTSEDGFLTSLAAFYISEDGFLTSLVAFHTSEDGLITSLAAFRTSEDAKTILFSVYKKHQFLFYSTTSANPIHKKTDSGFECIDIKHETNLRFSFEVVCFFLDGLKSILTTSTEPPCQSLEGRYGSYM